MRPGWAANRPATQTEEATRARDRELVGRLRDGDEAAFAALVDDLHAALVCLAATLAPDQDSDEVARETWRKVLEGLDGFEGMTSLRAWVVGALLERVGPVASAHLEGARDEPAVERWRFAPPQAPRPGHWEYPPIAWHPLEDRLAPAEALAVVRTAVEALPSTPRQVIVLRDLAGCSPAEASELLGLAEERQRALLNQARTAVRQALERHVEGA